MTGTILSFELGLLWPVWIQDFGNVFGLGFTLEGFSFFLEAIFIGIYAYGWDRLPALAGAYAWALLRGRRGRYERTALGISLAAARARGRGAG